MNTIVYNNFYLQKYNKYIKLHNFFFTLPFPQSLKTLYAADWLDDWLPDTLFYTEDLA